MPDSRDEVVMVRWFLLAVLLLAIGTPSVGQDVGGRVALGGAGRLVSDRWSTAKGIFTNRSDQPASVTAVVTPPDGDGLQYGRRIEIPPMSSRVVQWPVRIPVTSPGMKKVDYLVFGGDDADGAIQRTKTQDLLRSFNSSLKLTDYGHAGLMRSPDEPKRETLAVRALLNGMLRHARREQIILDVTADGIDGLPESLDALDQLSITSDQLIHDPASCEAIRIWVQRGGRLHIAVDLTGPELASVLLGEALPLTHIDTTSETKIRLELDPRFPERRFQIREVEREFEEPVTFVRMMAEGGNSIFTSDGWPAVVSTDYGRGAVLLTMVSPSVLVDGVDLIPSSAAFEDVLFLKDNSRLISREKVVSSGADRIGYQIPGRGFAMAVGIAFPLALLAVGLWLQSRDAGERLIWAVPAVAIVIAMPALLKGWTSRSVAPETVIRTQVIRAVDGEDRIASDGYVTIYRPGSGELPVTMQDGSLFIPEVDASSRDYRRQTWTSRADSSWQALKPGVGIHTATTRDVVKLDRPMRVVATLNQDGLSGSLISGSLEQPRSAVLAGAQPNRQAVTLTGSDWKSDGENILAPDEFFRDTVMTDRQKLQTEFLAEALLQPGFPSRLSMLYWAPAVGGSIQIGSDSTRQDGNALVVQPVTLVPPEIGRDVTLPPVLFSYETIAFPDGSFGAGYNNKTYEWSSRDRAGNIMLAFNVPPECLPFEISQATVDLWMIAGSRTIEVLAGDYDNLQPVKTLNDFAESTKIELPIRSLARGERVYLSMKVSEAKVTRAEGVDDDDTDDAWQVKRVMLTLKGKRTE